MTTRLLAVLALAAALGLWTNSTADAADPKLPEVKSFDKLVIDSLRGVHNKGADLYNTSKDFPAAYRLYQGALEAVRPLLPHRPEAQKLIDDGLAAAEKEAEAARKAFVLHETIEAVRKHLKVANGLVKPDAPPPPKPEDKKSEGKKPEDKKGDPKGGAAASVSGTVTLVGKPLAAGEITVVSLNLPKPQVFTAAIKDGKYTFAEPIPPAQYAAIVTGKGVPEKYHLVSSSGLRVELKGGANEINLDLK